MLGQYLVDSLRVEVVEFQEAGDLSGVVVGVQGQRIAQEVGEISTGQVEAQVAEDTSYDKLIHDSESFIALNKMLINSAHHYVCG